MGEDFGHAKPLIQFVCFFQKYSSILSLLNLFYGESLNRSIIFILET